MVGRWHRTVRAMAAAALTVAMAASVGACGRAATPPQEAAAPSGPIDVVASVNQWGALAEEIGGDDVHVTSIVRSSSVDVHDFEPGARDMAALSDAEVVVANGAGYDDWSVRALPRDAELVSAAAAVGAADGDNPHLWFSKDARSSMAASLCDAFSKARPARAKAFQGRLKEWRTSEGRLDRTMAAVAEEHRDVRYAATESVAHYLMADLGLEDATPEGYAQAVASGGEVAPADLRSFRELLDDRGAALLVVNPQERSDAATMLADAAGEAGVPTVDVTEQMPKGQTTLVGWIGDLVGTIGQALGDGGTEGDGADGARP